MLKDKIKYITMTGFDNLVRFLLVVSIEQYSSTGSQMLKSSWHRRFSKMLKTHPPNIHR